MDELVGVMLSKLDWGQVVEGLTLRAEAWERTASWLEKEPGTHVINISAIEECSDPDEARAIAADYRRIIDAISKQV